MNDHDVKAIGEGVRADAFQWLAACADNAERASTYATVRGVRTEAGVQLQYRAAAFRVLAALVNAAEF